MSTTNPATQGARQVFGNIDIANVTGTWAYAAGTSGSITVPAGGKVIGISAAGGGSFTINGGDSITVPTDGSVNVWPHGNVIAPALVFTGTTSYFVEYVT